MPERNLGTEIKLHKQMIKSSNQSYRYEAKQAKLAVLHTCEDYMIGVCSKKNLEIVINSHPEYKKSFGSSVTNELVNAVLEMPESKRVQSARGVEQLMDSKGVPQGRLSI